MRVPPPLGQYHYKQHLNGRIQKTLEQILQRCHFNRHVCYLGATQSDMPACTVQLHQACMLVWLHLFKCVLYVMCRYLVYYKSTRRANRSSASPTGGYYRVHHLGYIFNVSGARVASLWCTNCCGRHFGHVTWTISVI